jgi:hypothetical protein
MGIGRDQFFAPRLVIILPMGFCYPGIGTAGDLPPRKECAPQRWSLPSRAAFARSCRQIEPCRRSNA